MAKRSSQPDKDEARILDLAKVAPLGGLSRLSILRPHRLPLGFGLLQDPISSHDARPQWECRPLTLAHCIEPMQKFRDQSETLLPLPRLFVADSRGSAKGRDVMEDGKVISVRETMLPVAPVPFDANGEDVDVMDAAVQAERHLQRLGGDMVYIGFGIYPGLDTTPSVPESRIDLETHRRVYAKDSILYTLPHGPAADFAEYLKIESNARSEALYQGRDELDDHSIPVPEFVPGAPVQEVEHMPTWRVDDALHEAGLT